jgi:hypothetical protein
MPPSRGRPANRQSKPKEVSAERKPALEQSPKTPSTPTIPQDSRKGGVRWRRLDLVANWFFRILTLISVSYLVADRLYEISAASVSSPASDPQNPLMSSFMITNNSHLFTLRNVEWACGIDYLQTEKDQTIHDVNLMGGTELSISPGQSIVFNCNKPTKKYAPFFGFTSPITDALLSIKVRYDVDINLIIASFYWKKYPPPAIFRWSPHSTYSQWIRGRSASE